MIRFACQCGHAFVLDDSEAAGLVQCPDCKKLNDVPTLEDLGHLDEEGVLQLKPEEIAEEPDRLAVLSRVYAKGRQDEAGNDIDFRQTPEDFAKRGIPVATEARPVIRPRYDPETGQLIRPIDVKPDPAPPPPIKPTLQYARHDTIRTEAPGPVELIRAVNVFAMLFVAIAMAFAGVLAFQVFVPIAGFAHMYFWIGPMAVIELIVLAHYGHVIEELGPLNHDELPRLLGDVSWHDNIWAPLRAIVSAIVICYLPSIAAFNLPWPEVAVVLGALLAGAGTYFFPAVLLILTTSGTISNLRPNRIMGTVNACGYSYLWCVGSWFLALLIYLLAFLRFVFPFLGQFRSVVDFLPALLTSLVMIPVLHVLTVPFAHVFAWQTGMLYRRYYPDFPWVGQRFEKSPRSAAPVAK